MPRKPRIPSACGTYHFISRGMNKRTLFHQKDDYAVFEELIAVYLSKIGLKLYHYCLMPNHVHLLISATEVGLLSRFAHFVHRRYVYYYCKTHGWSEQLFNRRFRSIPIESEAHLLECGRYIERNPLKANLAKDPGEWLYSSHGFYASGRPAEFLTANPLYDTLGKSVTERQRAYKAYVLGSRPYENLLDSAIANCVPSDLVR